MSEKPRVLVVGMGGVGSIASYTLQKNGKCELSVVARSSYDVLTTKGFNIESCEYGNVKGFKPQHVAKSVADAMDQFGPFDFVVVTTKNIPDISPVEDIIKPAVVAGKTVVVLLQNGAGIERSLFKAYPQNHVVSGVTMISSTLYGDLIKQPGPDLISFGAFINKELSSDPQIASAKAFQQLYVNDINNAKYDADVKYIRWRKLIYNAAVNTACAITNLDSGRLELFGGNDTIVRPAMREVQAIAKSEGVELGDDIIEYMITSDDVYYPPSMVIDIRKGNYTEYKVIVGNALDIAAENGVPAPTLKTLHDLLHLIQMRTMEAKGRFELPEQRPTPGSHYQIQYKN